MKKRILRIFAIVGVCTTLSACSVLSSLADQAVGLANLANCEYSLKNVTGLTIGGVNVKKITNGNITAADVVNLTNALLSKKVPMAMNVNIDVKNPTDKNAAMTAMDWILDIDGSQFAQGNSSKGVTVTKQATTTVPLGVNTDLYSMFSKDGINSLKNFVSSFKNDGTSSKVGLRIKPSLNVGSYVVPMPNYIKVVKKTGTKSNS
jgi:LEA14-like dessication related protein